MKVHLTQEERTSRIMRANRGKNTKLEVLFRKHLYGAGIRGYRLHWDKIPGKPDVTFVGKKIAVFVNGCYWHRCSKCKLALPKSNRAFWKTKFEKNILRDSENYDSLKKMGWYVIVFWECDINNDILTVLKKIKEVLNQRR